MNIKEELTYFLNYQPKLQDKIISLSITPDMVQWMISRINSKDINDQILKEFIHCYLSDSYKSQELLTAIREYSAYKNYPIEFFDNILDERTTKGSDQVTKSALDDFVILSIIAKTQLSYFSGVYRHKYNNKVIVSNTRDLHGNLLEVFFESKNIFEDELIQRLKQNVPLNIFSKISRLTHSVDELTKSINIDIIKLNSNQTRFFGHDYIKEHNLKKTNNYNTDQYLEAFDKISKECPEDCKYLFGKKLFDELLKADLNHIIRLWATEHTFIRSFYPKTLEDAKSLYKNPDDINILYWAPILGIEIADEKLYAGLSKQTLIDLVNHIEKRDSISIYEFELVKRHYTRQKELKDIIRMFAKLSDEDKKSVWIQTDNKMYLIHYLSIGFNINKLFDSTDMSYVADILNAVLPSKNLSNIGKLNDNFMNTLFDDSYKEYLSYMNTLKTLYSDLDELKLPSLFSNLNTAAKIEEFNFEC